MLFNSLRPLEVFYCLSNLFKNVGFGALFRPKCYKQPLGGDYPLTQRNKAIMQLIIGDLYQAASKSGNTANEIFNTLAEVHPEITFSQEEWDQLSQENKDTIIVELRNMLASLS